MRLGIGVTTYNRPDVYALAMEHYLRYRDGAMIAVVDDGSAEPARVYPSTIHLRHHRSYGVAQAKNSCLKLLEDCDVVALFDDDCFPRRAGWSRHLYEAQQFSGVQAITYVPQAVLDARDDPIRPTMTRTYGRYQLACYRYEVGAFLWLSRQARERIGGFGYYPGRFGFEHIGYLHRFLRAELLGEFPDPYVTVEGLDQWLWAMDLQGFPSGKHVHRWAPSLSEQERTTFAQQNQITYASELTGRLYKQYRIPDGERDIIDAREQVSPIAEEKEW